MTRGNCSFRRQLRGPYTRFVPPIKYFGAGTSRLARKQLLFPSCSRGPALLWRTSSLLGFGCQDFSEFKPNLLFRFFILAWPAAGGGSAIHNVFLKERVHSFLV